MYKKPFAWSFSVLDMFDVCRKKYYHLKVLKRGEEGFFKDEDSDASRDGKYIHEVMHNRVLEGIPLPPQIRQHDKIAKRFADAKGDKYGEMKLALNKAFEPRDFFAKDVWVRAILDLLIVRGDTAILIDWKTGKKKERWSQLRLAAAILSRYMPEIEHFKLVFVWLKDQDFSQSEVGKEDMKAIWLEFLPRVALVEDAIRTTDFPATQSPLCAWCPVTTCPHWIERN